MFMDVSSERTANVVKRYNTVVQTQEAAAHMGSEALRSLSAQAPRARRPWLLATVERKWHTQDSQVQILALAFR